jgi:hypothetical protein
MHFEVEMNHVPKYSWRLRYCELKDLLGGSYQAKVEDYLMVVDVVVVNEVGGRTSAVTLSIGLQAIFRMLILEYMQVCCEM